jgi:hypothetical protein
VKINRCYPAAIVQEAFLTIASARALDTTTDGYVTSEVKVVRFERRIDMRLRLRAATATVRSEAVTPDSEAL